MKQFSVLCPHCGVIQRRTEKHNERIVANDPLPPCPLCGRTVSVQVEEVSKGTRQPEYARESA